MTLILKIVAPERLPEAQKPELRLDRFGASIGRSAHADWRIHDARAFVSSIHCEVDYRDGCYWLTDRSTNGTILPDGQRLEPETPHRIRMGDRFSLGDWAIEVTRLEVAAGASPPPPATAATSDWPVDERIVAPPASRGWGGPKIGAEITGGGAMSENFAPPVVKAAPPPPAADSGGDVWGRLLESMQTPAAPTQAAPQFAPPPAPSFPAPSAPASSFPSSAFPETPAAASAPSSARADALLQQCIAGLKALVDARARAKADLGAQSTVLDLRGNNPLKFSRTADDALAQMLAPPQRGFLDGPEAVSDAFNDIQSHQLATLAAMQGALKATIDRFSPAAIRARVKKGFMDGLLPDARNAALWKAYEAEFEGVVKGSDEAFMDVFSKEFLRSYEQVSQANRRR